ncbi:hypothetical protein [Cellulosilyticum sp. I15G10I2]|uniref:hypothetical protein n=1 Tax=Cellulosilyticum sp. I15G10I2 TaxID=1892843 RepID=UPI00085C155E|nr:hypothetical protein [Cellulosilyticum sp. I15G10I2]
MNRLSRKYLQAIIIVVILLCVFYKLNEKYPSSTTIKGILSENGEGIEISEVVTVAKINDTESLVFYRDVLNNLYSALVKKTIRNRWIMKKYTGAIPLINSVNSVYKNKLIWTWNNFETITFTYGVIYDSNITRITIGADEAFLLKDIGMWYFIDKVKRSLPNDDIKGYNQDNQLIYSYYPDKALN